MFRCSLGVPQGHFLKPFLFFTFAAIVSILLTQYNIDMIPLTKSGINLTLIYETSKARMWPKTESILHQKLEAEVKEREVEKNMSALPSALSARADDGLQTKDIPAPKKDELSTGTRLETKDIAMPSVFTAGGYTYETPLNIDLRIQENDNVIPTSTNVTPPDAKVMIYNRVPKCGSSTMQEILKSQAIVKGFNHVSSDLYFDHSISYTEQLDLLAKIFSKREWPIKYPKGVYRRHKSTLLSYDQHFFFFNVTRHHYPSPIWINLIREPTDRFVSLFYYARSLKRWRSRTHHIKELVVPPKSWFNKILDVCLVNGDPECFPARGQMRELQLTYFCGHHPGCMQIGNKGAMQRAKRHVEMYYSVVGLIEEFPLSMKVLQEYVPRFWSNVTSSKLSTGKMKRNRASAHPDVSPDTLRRLRDLLREDLEFYSFVKQRLHKQAEALGLR
ncbi:uronyl 2-sulfotransferase homolog pip-like [Oratosquilla oratoria]|uniref:uronyl 2-sulfotransferase homolog pip-like n=1 Tax=Oratosquilla oratoria TaxID=337810 RepID=UPI003F76B6B0